MNFFHFDRRLLKNADWQLIGIMILFLIVSSFVIYSASRDLVEDQPYYYIIRHLLAMFLGMVLFFMSAMVDYSIWNHFSRWVYGIMIGLLILVLLLGREGNYGGQSWIPLGPLSLQPVELAKIMLSLTLAKLLLDENRLKSIRCLGPLLLLVLVPLGLVLLQPDLGSGLVLLAIWLGMVFVAGLDWRYIAAVIAAGCASVPLLWGHLEEYQKVRLLIFTNLEYYKTNSAYGKYTWQLIQSMIAIGSGRLWGKGFLQGTQTQLEFLPEKHSDMIFSSLAEEFGFVGASLMIVLYLILIYRIFFISFHAEDRYGKLICAGIGSMLLFHLLINVGMTLGVMPVTGIPWPLMSYASSNLMAVLWGLGIVTSVAMRSNKTLFHN
ncbi:MAG: rod shape-determining protein RodA [Negativicutes bacterium]|nr:rod shape-determining protein RodA [Negativicutes bacterium]